MDQVGSGDHHRLERDVAALEKNLPLRQETYCPALSVAGPQGCYEHSPVPSEVSRKARQG